ncbi:MAG: cyclodeaminase/cyclohydrolase family protein [Candidatus Omnitrophota bacterium]
MAARTPGFSKTSLIKFLDELGSSAPSPGGGAAAALTGAQGVALIEMVARLNDARFRKKEPKADPSAAKQRIGDLKKAKLRFLELIQEDVAAFQAISAAYKKGKENPAYQKALVKGYSAPLEMAELAVQAMQRGLEEKDRTSQWLYSDLAEAGILLDATYAAARLNVEINLKDLADRNASNRAAARLIELASRSSNLKNQLRAGGIS